MRRTCCATTSAVLRSLVYLRPHGRAKPTTSGSGREERQFSTTTARCESKGWHPAKLGMDGFTDVAYNTAADTFLERVESALETIGDTDTLEDVNLAGGVLVIETTSRGTFVLNKQAPNVQLWLSSPLSGPHHYDMTTSATGSVEWRADADGHSLEERLEKELSEVVGTEVSLSSGAGETE
ncbi:frataxin-like, mitochondrial precursor, putative [Trypanosoma brucei gambiense DAL972]|uniref:ferroxidase n=2 Tax=Trypanosoma brucei TaxID=5691 RepID=C9ZJW6_TRYB9|nr:frataxin-like, mitochondrial precursor, putative [Trypanosoma brucei gambiense DAL972]RHW73831.1 frataxin-like [Trypanosoma brucei equiperdum]CBH09730.1 frataxin-like, mitochondrial precursor, putative [Trypanosoma brucei gambiense DAL972]|eukprot:XP_011772023.1 frataxin-like, mitochondrial precursor, putative [Trypanosoma brucei gambiense DAL972]